MTLLKLSRLFLNLHKLIDAEELDEPAGRLEVTMESGRVRILDPVDSAIVREALARLAARKGGPLGPRITDSREVAPGAEDQPNPAAPTG